MISGALLADAAIGNVQERAMREYGSTAAEMVLYSYSLGALYIFLYLLLLGTLPDAIQLFIQVIASFPTFLPYFLSKFTFPSLCPTSGLLSLPLQDPVRRFGLVCLFSFTGYCGVNFVIFLIQTHGALIAVTGIPSPFLLPPCSPMHPLPLGP